MTISGNIIIKTVLSGDIGKAYPSPPVPSRGDHYTDQLNYTAVMTQAITKEVDT